MFFVTELPNVKYLGKNLSKDVREHYNENYKT
jgi:hypothetical protein